MLTLRPYQSKAVQDIRSSYVAENRSPLLVLPTGGGKTVIFCHVAKTTAARGKRVLILVHRVELLRQTHNALTRSNVEHGLIYPKYTPDVRALVQVASVQTLVNRLEKIEPPDLIVIDEAHHAVAGTWRKILDRFPNARVLGVTATPCRGDGIGLGIEVGGAFDDLVVGPQMSQLISDGFLSKPIIYAPSEKLDLSGVRTTKGDYDINDLLQVVDTKSITGNAVDHYRKLCSGMPAVAFCVSVNHAEHVAQEFRAAGYRAYSVDGAMDAALRARIIGGLGTGAVDIVTSCDLISEGTDIPAVGAGIMLRPTQSLGLFLQQSGRILRPVYAPGFDLSTKEGRMAAIAAGPKPNGSILLDHVGNVITHGMPDEAREWTLEGEERKKRKKNEEPAVRVKQCDKCYAIHEPAPMCPVCGYVYEATPNKISEVDGELSAVTAEDAERMKRMRNVQLKKEEKRCSTLEEWRELAVARGYKPGWADHKYKLQQDGLEKRYFRSGMH